MTPEQHDAAVEGEQEHREFARLMEQLSDALSGCDRDTRTLGQAHVIETAERAVAQWEAMT